MSSFEQLQVASPASELGCLNRGSPQFLESESGDFRDWIHEPEAFTQCVAHDLRVPLRTILAFCQILRHEHGEQLDQQGRDYLSRIAQISENMGELLDALMQFSRAQHIPLSLVPVDLSLLALGIVAMLRRHEGARNLNFKIAAGLQVCADRSLLQLVLQNLLQNACKFTRHCQHAVVELGSVQLHGHPTYFVRDNGVGFDQVNAQEIFCPFQRLHHDEFEGSGIGLATVSRIIRRHHGRIWAESAVGRGATFFFQLGLADEDLLVSAPSESRVI